MESLELSKTFLDQIDAAPLSTLLSTRQFIEIVLMNIASVLVGLFVIGSAKTYGQYTIKDEKFLNIAATSASIFGVFRFIWSTLMDKYSFKLVYGVLMVI